MKYGRKRDATFNYLISATERSLKKRAARTEEMRPTSVAEGVKMAPVYVTLFGCVFLCVRMTFCLCMSVCVRVCEQVS